MIARSSAPRQLTYFAEVKQLLTLAWPVMLSRIGIVSLSVVDTIMVGRYASAELAYLGIGQVPLAVILLLSIGLLMGTMVLSSKHYGAKEYAKCGEVWWRSLPFALLIGFLGLGVCLFGENILLFMGQSEEIAYRGGRISVIMGLGLPLATLHITTGFFLEGINKMRSGMVIMLTANVMNIFLNDILINGHFGFPPMGAEGSAWATLIVRAVQAFLIVGYAWCMVDHKRFAVRKRPNLAWKKAKNQREIGYAAGLSLGIENTAFNALVLFAGLISTATIGAYTITLNLFALFFMFGIGLGSATSVRVGNAFGAGDMKLLVRRAWVGLSVQGVLMFFAALFLFYNASLLVGFYTEDAEVYRIAALLLAYASLAVITDAGQTLMAQALRARGDNWVTTGLQLVSFGLIMIPVAYIAVFPLGRGPIGLIDGLLAGTFIAFILCIWRFAYLADKDKGALISN